MSANQQIQQAQEMGFTSDIIDRATKMFKKGDNLIELCLEVIAKRCPKYDPEFRSFAHAQLIENNHIDYDQDYNLTDRIRKKNLPIGLMNVGNTCYFNSLIQSYFNNSEFCKYILKYRYPSSLNLNKLSKHLGEQKAKRVKASINLVVHLQRLFSYMILSDKKFFNPSNVLKNIVNTYGDRLKIGDQQDIGEFNLTFLSRVEEGLIYAENNVTKLEDKWFERQNQQLAAQQSQQQQSLSQMDVSIAQEESEEDKRIKSLYFGKRTQVSTFLQDGQEISHSESQEFSQIYLRLECKDLYTAWEEQRMYTVDDFKNDKNETVTATMQLWVSKVPEALLFQIQRMQYDKKTQEVVKLHSEFNFDKEIYIDRFLETNKEMYIQIQNKLQSFKKKKEELIQQIESYQNFNQSSLGVDQLLGMVQQFYENQDKYSDGGIIINQSDRENVLKILDSSKQIVKEKIAVLESQLKNIKDEEDKLFQSMKKQKYILQSILIHKGTHAEFGHYYSYILDLNQQKWFKYDDINCFEVDEQEVFRNAKGFGDQSAYGLIYINEELAQKNKETIYMQDTTNLIQYLPINLKDEIFKENKQFQIDLQEYQLQQQVSTILREYERRFTFVELYFKRLQKMQVDGTNPCLINFGGFLYQQRMFPLFNLHLLDTALKTSISPSYSLHDLLKEPVLLQKLKEGLRNLSQNRQFNLTYTVKEIQMIDVKFSEFIQYIKCCSITCIILEQALNQNWESSLVGIHKLIKQNAPEQTYYKKFGDYVLSILLIKLSCLIYDFCGQDTPANIFKIITLIVAFSKLMPKDLEIQQKQIKLNLQDFSKNAEQIFDKATLKNYNDNVKFFSDNSKLEQYEPVVKKAHPEIEQKIEDIMKEMDKQYFWNTSSNEDKYLNQLLNLQKQFDTVFKKIVNLLTHLKENKPVLSLKDRIGYCFHSDLYKK